MKILTGVKAEGLRFVQTKFSVNWGSKTDSTFQYNPVTWKKVVFERNFLLLLYAQILLRIWDIFFYEGSVTLFRMTLGMLKMKV